jgi:hypothetical protein
MFALFLSVRLFLVVAAIFEYLNVTINRISTLLCGKVAAFSFHYSAQ